MLRDYQQEAIEKLRESLAANHKPVLAAPTGSGKTRIAAEIFALARNKGSRVAFVVPFLSLIEQTSRAFTRNGLLEEEISIVQSNHPLCNYEKPIQICSVDTLARRQKLPDVEMVIFDECHRNSKVYKRWMDERPDIYFIGLSATPWARGMAELWDDLIIVETTRGLINKGFLSDYSFFAPASPDLTGVSIVMDDYNQSELGDAMNKPELVADIVKTWIERAEGRPTIAFCVDRQHARQVQYQFNNAGYPCGYIDAFTPVDEREQLVEALKDGRLAVIANIGTMTTGLDAPFVSCIILARPTRSEMLFVQMIGRGLRKSEGKDKCLVLDHSDTGLRLGLPCTIIKRKLYAGKRDVTRSSRETKEREDRLPHKCVKCDFLVPVGIFKCPSCGHEPERQSSVTVRDGILVEMRPDGTVVPAPEKHDFRQHWYSGLLFIAAERGYNEGWAAHKYKEKFGNWPERYLRRSLDYPTQNMRNFVKSRQIAYSKRNLSPKNGFRTVPANNTGRNY